MFHAMSRKPNPKWDDPEESQRFLAAAVAAEASHDPKDFERALIKVAPRKSSRLKTPRVN
jgi:hypothetical protein